MVKAASRIGLAEPGEACRTWGLDFEAIEHRHTRALNDLTSLIAPLASRKKPVGHAARSSIRGETSVFAPGGLRFEG